MSDCLFCKIIAKEIPAREIYRDDTVVAFHDINPKAPVHVLLVPVRHIESLIEAKEEDKELLGSLLLRVRDVAKSLGIDQTGYKIAANNGKMAGQMVFHLHFHVLGGWKEVPSWEV